MEAEKIDRSYSSSGGKEAQKTPESNDHSGGRKRGGWITFPFVLGTTAFMTVGGMGWVINLAVYLIQQFNIGSIDATQIVNIVNGSANLFPVIASVIADSFLGSFSVAKITTYLSVLGTVVLTLTATIGSLRPEACTTSNCEGASGFQFTVLYAGLALSTIGLGGFRYTAAAMGAEQFDNQQAEGVFFNWFFFTIFAGSVVATTFIVFVQNSISWGLGFGLCATSSLAGLLLFLSGKRFYRVKGKPQESPFTAFARVLVAALRKRNLAPSSKPEDYHYNGDVITTPPKNTFRFLNRAAQKIEGDINWEGSVVKPWSVCTVEQVEDLKTVVRMLPLWSAGILVSTPIAVQISFTILQALTMDPHMGPHFKVPPSSILVVVFLTTSITLFFIDRFLQPTWLKITGRAFTPLQRIGVGHVLNILSMVASAIVESKRLKAHKKDPANTAVPMSMLWLCVQLVINGVGEAFHFPGTVAFFYQEFPPTLCNMATGIVGVIIGIAFYLSTALVDLMRRVTDWLPNDINNGRIDNAYWVIAALGLINFFYFLVCATLYRYQNIVNVVDDHKDEDGS